MKYNVLILGASYGSLLATKLLMAGHHVTLVCTGPTARLTSERIASIAPLLVEESNKLAARLGHRDHARGAA